MADKAYTAIFMLLAGVGLSVAGFCVCSLPTLQAVNMDAVLVGEGDLHLSGREGDFFEE